MFEIISQINDQARRLGKLESLETPFKSYGLWANRPTVPFDGQRFFATDSTRRIEYEWDNTAGQWLSTQQFPATLVPRVAQPFPAGTVDFDGQIPNYNLGGWKLESIFISVLPNTIQSGTVFYNVAAFTNTVAGGFVTHTLTGTKDTKLATSTTAWYPFSPTVSTILTNAYFDLDVRFSIGGGAPGTFFGKVSAQYRLVG